MQFDELDGEEVKQILRQRFDQVLDQVPYLKKHITLPRVRITTQIQINCWADQQGSEDHVTRDEFTLGSERSGPPATFEARDVVDASPSGSPPDQWRDEAGIEKPSRMPVVLPRQPVEAPDTAIPGMEVRRGENLPPGFGIRSGTAASIDRGGPVVTGHTPVSPNLRNQDRGPSDPLDRSFPGHKERT